ncbi:MAG: Radical domain protein [Verrucomicrobiaceae bacterium]|nr:Radical domain protein [Verrucomicrobiaceae bacterium]
MPDIVLATLNAKFIHSSFGLRYLMANLGELKERACMAEFQINQAPIEILEAVLALEPRVVGFGIYIWNVVETTEVLGMLRRLRPDIRIVLGGPEVSYEVEGQPIVALADHVITGEADLKFAEVCAVLLGDDEQARAALPKVMNAGVPALANVALPYDLYSEADLANRILYVEASRGCPFTCEFCLSSLDIPIRAIALETFLAAMQGLLDRGALTFKFVDRTFNLHLPTSMAILRFFLDRWRDGMFLHFEMVPDRLPDGLRDLIRQFPAGAVQFEVGIQTFDDATSKNISRRQNLVRLEDNLRFLREETGIHVHADLIVGLPGENVESFGRGFDRLVAMRPQEIQVGILKRLRGTPIVRHDTEYQMKYSPVPPYEMLENRDIPFVEMQRMRRFARYWDMVANSGNFTGTLGLLWQQSSSTFIEFLAFADDLYARLRRTHQIALPVLAYALFDFLTQNRGVPADTVAVILNEDWNRVPGRERLHLAGTYASAKEGTLNTAAGRRQARHLAQH